MIAALQNFDPLTFLQINTSSLSSQQETQELRATLYKELGEYVLTKCADTLTDEQINFVLMSKDGAEMLQRLQTLIPNFEAKMLLEMENFKREFTQHNT